MPRICEVDGSHGAYTFDIDTGEIVSRETGEYEKGDYFWVVRIALPETMELLARAGVTALEHGSALAAINVCYHGKRGKLYEGAVWIEERNQWVNRHGKVTG